MEGALTPGPLGSPPPAPYAAAPPSTAAPPEPPAAVPVPYPPPRSGAPEAPAQPYAPAPSPQSYAPGPGGAPSPYAPAPYGGAPQPYAPTAMCAVHAETPAIGLCARCGAYVCPWCQRIASDGTSLCAACLDRLEVGGPVPWDLRPELGLWRAWWRTFKESLTGPNQFFARACHSPFSKAPVLYATMSVWFGQSWVMLLYGGIGIGMAVAGKEPAVGIGMAVGAIIGLSLMAPVSALMQMYLSGGITHLFARMFGGKGTYQQSARALGFAIGPYAIGIIPYLGGMAAMVVSVVLQVYAMKHAHGLTGGKAAAAVLLPLGILMVLCCFGYVGLIAAVVTARH
jgi:hypothetical protein